MGLKGSNSFTDAANRNKGNKTVLDIRDNEISRDQASITEEVDSDNTIDQEERGGTDLNEESVIPNRIPQRTMKKKKRQQKQDSEDEDSTHQSQSLMPSFMHVRVPTNFMGLSSPLFSSSQFYQKNKSIVQGNSPFVSSFPTPMPGNLNISS